MAEHSRKTPTGSPTGTGMARRSLLAAPAWLSARAGTRIQAAVVGAGSRGRYHIGQFRELGAQVAWVCDVYEPNRAAGLAAAGSGAQGCDDYRRALDDKSVDAVVIAAPDHLHARMAIDAMDSGKDVYIEKPLAHTVEDGFRVCEARRRTGRIAQVGMQRRSMPLFQESRKLVGEAGTGQVRLVNSWWYNRIDQLNPGPLQGRLNWDQFVGPAPMQKMDAVRFLNWYWFWDYGGGMMVAQAAHIIDTISWLLGARYPVAVTAAGNGCSLPLAEVPPNTSMSVEYPGDILVVFTVGYHAMRYSQPLDQMIQFHGARARLDLGREFYALYPEDAKSGQLSASAKASDPGGFARSTVAHIRNFLDCVQSRKEPNATPEMAQYTNVVLCLAAESLRSGRRVRFDASRLKAEA